MDRTAYGMQANTELLDTLNNCRQVRLYTQLQTGQIHTPFITLMGPASPTWLTVTDLRFHMFPLYAVLLTLNHFIVQLVRKSSLNAFRNAHCTEHNNPPSYPVSHYLFLTVSLSFLLLKNTPLKSCPLFIKICTWTHLLICWEHTFVSWSLWANLALVLFSRYWKLKAFMLCVCTLPWHTWCRHYDCLSRFMLAVCLHKDSCGPGKTDSRRHLSVRHSTAAHWSELQSSAAADHWRYTVWSGYTKEDLDFLTKIVYACITLICERVWFAWRKKRESPSVAVSLIVSGTLRFGPRHQDRRHLFFFDQ